MHNLRNRFYWIDAEDRCVLKVSRDALGPAVHVGRLVFNKRFAANYKRFATRGCSEITHATYSSSAWTSSSASWPPAAATASATSDGNTLCVLFDLLHFRGLDFRRQHNGGALLGGNRLRSGLADSSRRGSSGLLLGGNLLLGDHGFLAEMKTAPWKGSGIAGSILSNGWRDDYLLGDTTGIKLRISR